MIESSKAREFLELHNSQIQERRQPMSNIQDSVNAWLALPHDSEECERGYIMTLDDTDNFWECLNAITSCFYNDGYNLCVHDGNSRTPLEDAVAAFEPQSIPREMNNE